MRALLAIVAGVLLAEAACAQTTASFAAEDGGVVYADVYGSGERAVLLAHGGRFTKESWAKQAPVLVKAGFEVMAIDFRGRGKSNGPGGMEASDAQLEMDVMAAVRYLHAHGAKSVSIVGGSMGGGAAGDASIVSKPGEIDRIVMLGAAPNLPAERLKSPALFIVARDDTSGDGPRLPGIRAQYEKAPEPKRLVVLEGSAHAQYLFDTEQGERVMREILGWLELQPTNHRPVAIKPKPFGYRGLESPDLLRNLKAIQRNLSAQICQMLVIPIKGTIVFGEAAFIA